MKKLLAYLVVLFSAFTALRIAIARWVTAWTATEAECAKPLTGDEIVENPQIQTTHAVTIQAPPDYVWQWLVQMGAERAGWYSYDHLDNDGIPSAETIVPDYQTLEVGDVVKALPNTEGGFEVAQIDEPTQLVYTTYTPMTFDRTDEESETSEAYYWRTTWAFVLEPSMENATRLLVRARVNYHLPEWLVPIVRVMARPVHFIMQQRQLANIQQRAETYYADEMRLKTATVNV